MGDRCGGGKRSFVAKTFVHHSGKFIFVPGQLTWLLRIELLACITVGGYMFLLWS